MPLKRALTLCNGLQVKLVEKNFIRVTRMARIESLKIPNTEKGFKIQRALAQYIGVKWRPDICARVQLISPGSESISESQFVSLRKAIGHLKSRKETELDFVEMDMMSMQIVALSDSSYANADGMKSQLVYVSLMVSKTCRASIVHYGSGRCHRVLRSVMAPEVHALVHSYDNASVVRDALTELIGREVDEKAYVDSCTLYKVVVKNDCTAERRVQTDLRMLRESYRKRELKRVLWIPDKNNAANVLTNEMLMTKSVRWKLTKNNEVELQPIDWARKDVTNKMASLSTLRDQRKLLILGTAFCSDKCTKFDLIRYFAIMTRGKERQILVSNLINFLTLMVCARSI